VTDTSEAEKLQEVRRAWRDADDQYNADILAAAGDPTLTARIEANWWDLFSLWSKRNTAALEKNNAAVAAAYDAAKAANDKVEAGRAAAEKLAKTVAGVAQVVTALGTLFKAVGPKS